MITEILSSSSISRAAELLKKGEVVAFPTETVYGLGACLFDEDSLRKIYTAKGRPRDNPFIAHMAEKEDIFKIVAFVSDDAARLIDAFFPGPLTLILPKHPEVPSFATSNLPSIAFRMPSSELARELIRQVGMPLAGTSANLSGRPSPTCARHVLDDLDGKISAVIDGGECQIGIESTVLNLMGEPMIVRPGSITASQIEGVIKKPVAIFSNKLKGSDQPLSPGMKYRHYAPKAPVKLFFSEQQWAHDQSINHSSTHLFIPEVQTHELYRILREADSQGFEEISIFCSPNMQKDLALMNRLFHASDTTY